MARDPDPRTFSVLNDPCLYLAQVRKFIPLRRLQRPASRPVGELEAKSSRDQLAGQRSTKRDVA